MKLLALAIALCWVSGCNQPCRELADVLCSQNPSDDAACSAWRARTDRVPRQTCEFALRSWQRDRAR